MPEAFPDPAELSPDLPITNPTPNGENKARKGNPPASHRSMTYIRDLGVGALALGAGQLQPLAVLGWAVLLQRALVLSLAPATLEVGVGFQAESAAVPHGPALVQVNCRDSKNTGPETRRQLRGEWDGSGRKRGKRSGLLVSEAGWKLFRGVSNGGENMDILLEIKFICLFILHPRCF